VETIWISAAEWLGRARSLQEEGWLIADLTGLDAVGLGLDHRFDVVIHLLHMESKERRRIHVVAAGDPPTVPSVTQLWPAVNFMEREAYDMFGIIFEGHPNLTRILMPDEWEGHPLRKDYGVGKVVVEFIPQPFLQIEGPGQLPNTQDAGRAVDRLGQPVAEDGKEART
jgi:NADH:ubiquinone oxidoreductase subunit C